MARPTNITLCSFCGKSHAEVKKLIAGPGVYICDNCVVLCKQVLDKELATQLKKHKPRMAVAKPAEIKRQLDLHCVGQDHAKKTLAVAVHNHYKRIVQEPAVPAETNDALPTDPHSGVAIEKSNILMVGPTGSGKTLLARTLAQILDVSFAMADATTLTEAGYVGEDVENIILRLLQNSDYDLKKAQRGIVYIDEIDKIARKTENVSIERIIQRRLGRHAMGFRGSDEKTLNAASIARQEILQHVEPEDLLSFGFIPEFIGRLPMLTVLAELTEGQLVSILTDTKNALTRQYAKLLAMEGVELEFSDDALSELAGQAIRKGTGARALRSLLEKLMLDVMYDVPSSDDILHIMISRGVVAGESKPLIRRKHGRAAA